MNAKEFEETLAEYKHLREKINHNYEFCYEYDEEYKGLYIDTQSTDPMALTSRAEVDRFDELMRKLGQHYIEEKQKARAAKQ